MPSRTAIAALLSALCGIFRAGVEAFAPTASAGPSRRKTAALPVRSTPTATVLSANIDGGGEDSGAGFLGRREAVGRGLSSIAFAAATAAAALSSSPSPAQAKGEPVTPELITSTFSAVRYQLESASDGIPQLQSLIEAEDYPAVMEFTKLYDGAFRKGKMKPARKLLTDSKAKDDALMLSNAVTFDLIGINKNSRPGQESKEGALKYLGELKADVNKFLDLEGTIDLGGGAK